jgi:alkylhydroperoxidase family enzyme
MALIKTVSPENATGIIKEGYDMYLEKAGSIPKPMEMISASPGLFELSLRRMHYLSSHPTLSFALLTHIRYLVSSHLGYRFCRNFNRGLLEKQGLEQGDFERMESDSSQSLLEQHENAMLAFVVKAVSSPDAVTAEDIAELRNLGWEDRDLVDALAQGVSMYDHAVMMKVFQMD